MGHTSMCQEGPPGAGRVTARTLHERVAPTDTEPRRSPIFNGSHRRCHPNEALSPARLSSRSRNGHCQRGSTGAQPGEGRGPRTPGPGRAAADRALLCEPWNAPNGLAGEHVQGGFPNLTLTRNDRPPTGALRFAVGRTALRPEACVHHSLAQRGDPIAEVARRVGNSPEVIHRRYRDCIDGHEEAAT